METMTGVKCDWCGKVCRTADEAGEPELRIWRDYDPEHGLWIRDELICGECWREAVDEQIPF